MARLIYFFLWIVTLIILQVSILPAYLDEPFKPNLLIILICFLALRGESTISGALAAYVSGLIQGVFSGLYFGLAGISSLLIYFVFRKISDQLYTESTHLLVVAVCVASLADSLTALLLTALLSVGAGVYSSILTYMVPHALITALIAAVFSSADAFFRQKVAR